MARMIFISPYLKGGTQKAKLVHRTNYIATREGVELLRDDDSKKQPTKRQTEFITRAHRDFPEAKELAEYADYRANPNRKSAGEFISQVWEQYVEAQDKRENFLDYVSHRPGVKSFGDHGLWDRDGKVKSLKAAVDEVANHEGNVWTPVISLRREDAERLGFTEADRWRALINSCTPEIARGYKIPLDHLRWYAALHEKEKHFHVHLVLFSSNPKEGYLTKQGIRDIKSALAGQMYKQDLICVYKQKDEYRGQLNRSAAVRMNEVITQMETGTLQSETLEQLLTELAVGLRNSKGRKVYGYLSPSLKSIVDQIVEELAKDGRVAEAYQLWQDMQVEVVRTYTDELPERLPLSRQKEFKTVRNMVVREAVRLAERQFTFEDEAMEDEPKDADEPDAAWEAIQVPKRKRRSVYDQARRYNDAKKTLYDRDAVREEALDAISELEALWNEGYLIAAHLLGKAYRDGLGIKADAERAVAWFRKSTEAGNDFSGYALGKLLLEHGNNAEGVEQMERAAVHGNQYAQYRMGKLCLAGGGVAKNVGRALYWLEKSAAQNNQYAQYTLGKLFLLGKEVDGDRGKAVAYLTNAAGQGNVYAQFFLDHLDDRPGGGVGFAVLRMLHSMGQIFREETAKDGTFTGLQ
ncbi:MAG: SEL1-like repeat protein, partial [Oscillospiraceae bacterium]|nr:SEL1-like repeat protein [Oscillospiraceae bacterium]